MSFFGTLLCHGLLSPEPRLRHLNLWLRLYRSGSFQTVCTGAAACAEKLLLENALFLASAGSFAGYACLFRRCIVETYLR